MKIYATYVGDKDYQEFYVSLEQASQMAYHYNLGLYQLYPSTDPDSLELLQVEEIEVKE